jgi:hypothetical protein
LNREEKEFYLKRFWMLAVLAGALSRTCFAGSAVEMAWEKALPVLQTSCFPCHAPEAVPAPKPAVSISTPQKRRKMIAQAVSGFPMGEKFPFKGGASPEKQMKKMRYMLSVGRMPPNGHLKVGLGEPLKTADRKTLMDWLQTPLK